MSVSYTTILYVPCKYDQAVVTSSFTLIRGISKMSALFLWQYILFEGAFLTLKDTKQKHIKTWKY